MSLICDLPARIKNDWNSPINLWNNTESIYLRIFNIFQTKIRERKTQTKPIMSWITPFQSKNTSLFDYIRNIQTLRRKETGNQVFIGIPQPRIHPYCSR